MFNEKFDTKLRTALLKHIETTPDDFKKKMLNRVELLENERILNYLIWQERFPLVGSVLIGIVIIALTLVFPDAIDLLIETFSETITELSRIVKIDYQEWVSWGTYGASLGFAIYCLAGLFVSDS